MNRFSLELIKQKEQFTPAKVILHLVSVIVIVSLFLLLFGRVSGRTGIQSIDGGIAVVDPSGKTYEILYVEVTEVELIDLPENLGVCIDGASARGYSYGVWENDDWGRFDLCIKDDVKEAVRIRQGDEIFIFNYEGSQSTESFYDALLKKLQEG